MSQEELSMHAGRGRGDAFSRVIVVTKAGSFEEGVR